MQNTGNPSLAQVRMNLKQALTPKYGEGEASAMAMLVIMTLKGWDKAHVMANELRPASDFIINRCEEILGQLLNDVPIQYALGETTFYGLRLRVGPGVLIPRPETEELVDIIVADNQAQDLRVLDLCTGSGAIALALARALPFSTVEGIDISQEALKIAAENAAELKIKLSLSRADIFYLTLPSDEFDIIVSNPPYVCESEKKEMDANVLDYEPHEALFVPDDQPLLFYNRIAEIAYMSLKAGGRLYLEINPLHSSALKEMLEKEGFEDVEILKDSYGKDRFARAIKR